MHNNSQTGPFEFDLYIDRLPPKLHKATLSFIYSMIDALTTDKPVALQVVAYSPLRWDFRPSSIQLHSVSDFKSRYHFILL